MQNLAKISLLLLIAVVSTSFAFQCYVCNSKKDPGCDSPPDEKYLKTCEDAPHSNHNSEPFTVCRLQVIASETEGTTYDRRCGWIKHNENRETCLLTTDPLLKATNCECHTDRCNGALSATQATSVLVLGATLFMVFMVRN